MIQTGSQHPCLHLVWGHLRAWACLPLGWTYHLGWDRRLQAWAHRGSPCCRRRASDRHIQAWVCHPAWALRETGLVDHLVIGLALRLQAWGPTSREDRQATGQDRGAHHHLAWGLRATGPADRHPLASLGHRLASMAAHHHRAWGHCRRHHMVRREAALCRVNPARQVQERMRVEALRPAALLPVAHHQAIKVLRRTATGIPGCPRPDTQAHRRPEASGGRRHRGARRVHTCHPAPRRVGAAEAVLQAIPARTATATATRLRRLGVQGGALAMQSEMANMAPQRIPMTSLLHHAVPCARGSPSSTVAS
mmetsp:Transcript_118174/g.294790  ORF Transcript_118174/g.294790 Transcript_118174/m.294790 type:complete len:308 (+) Transcript_118174:1393-2316(+)